MVLQQFFDSNNHDKIVRLRVIDNTLAASNITKPVFSAEKITHEVFECWLNALAPGSTEERVRLAVLSHAFAVNGKPLCSGNCLELTIDRIANTISIPPELIKRNLIKEISYYLNPEYCLRTASKKVAIAKPRHQVFI